MILSVMHATNIKAYYYYYYYPVPAPGGFDMLINV